MNNNNETPPGWNNIIHNLHTKISHLEPNYTLNQAKEKFGQLRYYITTPPTTHPTTQQIINDLITLAEQKSAQTCQKCGKHGTPHKTNGWITTHCKTCHQTQKTQH